MTEHVHVPWAYKLGKVIGLILFGPFILLGVAIGVIFLAAQAVIKARVKQAPVAKPVGIKETDKGTITAPINWNTMPVGRMDKGGTG